MDKDAKQWLKDYDDNQESYKSTYLPVMLEAIKGIRGIQLRKPTFYDGTIMQLAMPSLHVPTNPIGPNFDHDPLSIKFEKKEVQIIYGQGEVIHKNHGSLGDPNIIQKIRQDIVSWKRMERSRRFRYEREVVEEAKRIIKLNQRAIKNSNMRLENFKVLMREQNGFTG